MKPVPIDDLPQYSEWAAYLLDPVGDPPEEPERYASTDYYEELGQQVLEAYREDPVDAAELHRRGRAYGRGDPDLLSVDEELFLASVDELIDRERTSVREALAPVLGAGDGGDGATVVDLGCGWGVTLRWIADAFPVAAVIGGEYSEPAVELGRAVHADHDRISIRQFDFRDAWAPLDAASERDGDVVVFTRGAVTTLDDVGAVVDRFAERATDGDVVAGVHLEQVDAHPETVLGSLRRRYGRVRGYDGSLLEELREDDELAVTAVEYDVLGANPPHPHTLVRWRLA